MAKSLKSLAKIFKPKKGLKRSRNSITIPFPRLKSLSLNMYLVFVIVIFAFILGMLTIKVLDLQQQVNVSKDASAAVAQNGGSTLPSVAPSPAAPVNVAVGNYPARGNDNAKVTVIE